jgi:hypothetical protein
MERVAMTDETWKIMLEQLREIRGPLTGEEKHRLWQQLERELKRVVMPHYYLTAGATLLGQRVHAEQYEFLRILIHDIVLTLVQLYKAHQRLPTPEALQRVRERFDFLTYPDV